MSDMFKPVDTTLPVEKGFWSDFKAFWLQDVNIELTPKQQKIENEINEFLYQEITWQKIHDFLFQEVTFGKKNNNNGYTSNNEDNSGYSSNNEGYNG